MNINSSLILKLKKLSNNLGGDIIELSEDKFLNSLRKNLLHRAPFTRELLAIDYYDKIVYHTGNSKWYHIIHEMAHIFACQNEPYNAIEFDFLGWEYITAKYIKAPLNQWHSDMKYYVVDKNGTRFWSLSKYKKAKLIKDRIIFAKENNLISRFNKPLSVR